jgi:hypothetical protein
LFNLVLSIDGSLIYRTEEKKQSTILVGMNILTIENKVIALTFDLDFWYWIQSLASVEDKS